MTNLLVKIFIKNSTEVGNPKVRGDYGVLSSFVGIACNILLFLVKYFMGTMSNSIAIISDAFNNLSDSASCIVTLFGYKLSAKPADKDHPFGHGRFEYITSLVIATVIMFMGFELFKDSASKIIHPEEVTFSWIVVGSLVLSIGLKVWMSFFNSFLGKRINSSIMLATSKDSRNDVIATLGTLIALIASRFVNIPIDGIMGVVVSFIILRSGFGIVKDTVDELIGKPADKEIVEGIHTILNTNEAIMGMHDLMIHNYGPGMMIGSCHVEVRSDDDFVKIHDIIDQLERKIHDEFKIIMTIHMDPIEMDNEQVIYCKEIINRIIKTIDSKITIHDLRVVSGESHTNIIFDLVLPFDREYVNENIQKTIQDELAKEKETYYTVITFDREYM